MKIYIPDKHIVPLIKLAEWLDDQQYKPYQPDFNEKASEWHEIIECIIKEVQSEN